MNSQMKWIQSPENPLIKEIKKIKKCPGKRIFLEGPHLVETSLMSDYAYIEKVLVTEKFIEKQKNFLEILQQKKILVTIISEKVAKTISDTVTPQGVFAIADFKIKNINDLSNPTFIVIADRIQDPGNLGTIIRAAEAFGAEAVLVTYGTCNPFSNKALRASAGSIFFLPVINVTVKEIEEFVFKYGLNLVITDLRATISPFNMDFTKPLAIVFGNESKGVSQHLKAIKHVSCKIPHRGKAESLNVAMAATAILYEILRQRFLKSP
ncbi:TrmH family RNA methyltransferase [Thermodesulfovibrio yellowstonii]|uniref:RNA methyltransferase TrmH n=1 Tax=Thermodesulfovibrio yellowstonii TaxID=28262 RepID=A0A9W6LLX6_9BACT|nr:RNA methyltransferase [Thermodesulfovibrio islandicus]GLI54305.1 RNA methyltransferase TrmH [Thermodesulfovibrio islandicus]